MEASNCDPCLLPKYIVTNLGEALLQDGEIPLILDLETTKLATIFRLVGVFHLRIFDALIDFLWALLLRGLPITFNLAGLQIMKLQGKRHLKNH